MRLRVLGPLEAIDGSAAVPLGGRRQRVVLGVLVVHAPEQISRDALVHQVWGDDPPATAVNACQVYISQLRKVLGRERIRTEADGYRLVLDRAAVDAWEFADLVECGSSELEAGEVTAASVTLRRALDFWNGPPFVGLEDTEVLHDEAARLEALRLTALERRLDADLACGRAFDLVTELETLVREQPLRERFWA